MPKNRKMQNIIGTEHITDTAEAAIAAQAGSGNVVDDTTPQLGGNLDVNGNAVVSTANGNIELNPNGTGKVVFKGNATKGAGQFVLNCEVNTHGIVIKGPPHSASASYTLTLPDTDGAANEVLKTDGSGNLDWVAQSSGGGGMSPPHPPDGNNDVDDEIAGLSNGMFGFKNGNAFTNVAWANGSTRYRPHYFSKTGTLSNARFLITTAPTGASAQTVKFGIYESDSDNKPAALKCVATQSVATSTSANTFFTPSWVAESGKDLNVTQGELYYVAFYSLYGATSQAATFKFFTGNALDALAVDFDTSPQGIQTFYQVGAEIPSTLTIGSVAGDSSGQTWPVWGINYA